MGKTTTARIAKSGCTICSHPARIAIEDALKAGKSAELLAEMHQTTKDAMKEHRNHLNVPQVMSTNSDPIELMEETNAAMGEAWELIEWAKGPLAKTKLNVAERANTDPDVKGWAMGIRELRGLLEHKAKMLGAYEIVDPRFAKAHSEQLIHAITMALGEHPEARQRVIDAIEKLETKG